MENKPVNPKTTKDLYKETASWVFSVILFVVGIYFVILYSVAQSQTEAQLVEMLIGGLSLCFSGIIIAPPVNNLLSRSGKNGRLVKLGIVLFGASIAGYYLWSMVGREVKFVKQQGEFTEVTTQRLKDIRSAEEAYLEWTKVEEGIEEGYYLGDLDSLVLWIQTPCIKVPYDVGTDHTLDSLSQDSIDFYTIDKTRFPFLAEELKMTEDSLFALISTDKVQWKIRDNSLISFYDKEFAPEKRQKKNLPLVNLADLIISPAKGNPFGIKVFNNRIYVWDPDPLVREGQEGIVRINRLYFGDPELETPTTQGSWRK